MGFFEDIGNKINASVKDTGKKLNASVEHTNAAVKKSNTTIANNIKNAPKPKIDMKALQDATKIITGIVALTPVGRGLLTASVAIADKTTGGKATAYLGAQNSTLSMIPGGNLAQQIASVATNGRSNDTLNQYVPDPKKMAIGGVKTVGTTLVKNPSQTGNTITAVASGNMHSFKSTPVAHTLAKSAQSAVQPMVSDSVKPSIHSMMSSPDVSTIARPLAYIAPKPSMIQHMLPVRQPSTIKEHQYSEDNPNKPSILQAVVPVVTEAPPPPTSTLSMNVARNEAMHPQPLVVVSHSIFDFCTVM